ncbi:MAG: hypothetical protein GY786_03165 [Proteobacteria bacterium]|nr:hypothetical protein [Pseudomonadota bacterium]
MNALKIAIVMILLINGGYSLFNWLTAPEETQFISQQQTYNRSASIIDSQAADGLSLPALMALTKEIRSGQELERKLNQKSSINNLDLNGDEKVDYISVKEYGDVDKKIGYSLTTEPVKGEKQEVASIEVELNDQKAEIQIIGNEQLYGDNAIYNDFTEVERKQSADKVEGANGVSMYHSYFYPRPLWFSPFYFGFYPSYYSFFPIMSRPMYTSRVSSLSTQSVRRGASSHQSRSGNKITNPNQGKTAKKGISRSLKKPTSTQKSFQTTQKNNLRSGGFGSGRTNTNRQLQTSRSSSPSRSFGSSKRSLSTGRSSFRSGGFNSRSFSFGGK